MRVHFSSQRNSEEQGTSFSLLQHRHCFTDICRHWREGGREERKEGGKEGGRERRREEGGREGRREGRRKGGKEGGKEEGREGGKVKNTLMYAVSSQTHLSTVAIVTRPGTLMDTTRQILREREQGIRGQGEREGGREGGREGLPYCMCLRK